MKAPRRWSEELDGIRWLPRMIDKARMTAAGELGNYLMGNSPIDRALLERLGIGTGGFVAVVRANPTDADVLAALRARPEYDEARIRRWSQRMPKAYAAILALCDLDEGHRQPNWFARLVMSSVRPFEGGLVSTLRRVLRAP